MQLLQLLKKSNVSTSFLTGILLTLILALIAGLIAKLPFFHIMGIMIISILLGMTWKGTIGIPKQMVPGIHFSSKKLLRLGIILMGLRLDLSQIMEAGISVILIDILVILFTLIVMISIGKFFAMDKHLSVLIAVGTAVCGAAAIVAVAPLIKSKKEYTALAVACIAILGTFGALGYSFLYPILNLSDYQYGVLVGATLHELAHVIAAGVPAGDIGSETAILVKLGRVVLLIPVAIILEMFFRKSNVNNDKQHRSLKNLPVPWFIFGFLVMSFVHTFSLIPQSIINLFILMSVYLLSMAMAGLGLDINFKDFKAVGFKPIIVGILGFIALLSIGPFLLYLI